MIRTHCAVQEYTVRPGLAGARAAPEQNSRAVPCSHRSHLQMHILGNQNMKTSPVTCLTPCASEPEPWVFSGIFFPVYTSACRQSWSGERYPGQGSEWAPPSSGARGTADLVLFVKTSNLLSTDPLAPCFRARVCCSPCVQLVPPQQTLQPDLRRRLHTYATDKVGRGYVLRVASVWSKAATRVCMRARLSVV